MTFLRWSSPAAVGALIAASVLAPPAQAAYILTLAQEGPNVVATGSGTIDLAGLTFIVRGAHPSSPSITPSVPEILIGAEGVVDFYGGPTPPVNFGSGGLVFANAGSGDLVGADPFELAVPAGYVSGPLSGGATFDHASFVSLGITPGVYVWRWGSGADADTFTVDAVPEPSTWALIGVGFLGLAAIGMCSRRSYGASGRVK